MAHFDPMDVDDPAPMDSPEGAEEDNPLLRMDPIHPDRLENIAERRRQCPTLILSRRRIRDFLNPFDVTYETFVKSYRLTQDLVFSVVDLIRPYVARTSDLALLLELKVLAVLSFYSTGSYQTPTGKIFDTAVAQPTISKYIHEITTALNEHAIVSRFIRFPEIVEEVGFCVERNRTLGGKINDALAYPDGTLVKVRKPSIATIARLSLVVKVLPVLIG